MKPVKKLKVKLASVAKLSWPHLKKHRLIYSHCAIFLFSTLFFLIGIGRYGLYAGEDHYHGGAVEILDHGINTNWSHPPLAKILIAVGIKIFGNNPFGWRFMGAVFGALTLNAMFVLGLIFFKRMLFAFEVVALCFFNNFLFVQARMADMEVFVFAFIAWGLAFFFLHYEERKPKYLLASAFLFGLALAVKWFAIVPIIFCASLFFLDRKNRRDSLTTWACVLIPIATYILIYSFCIGMSHPTWGGQLEKTIANTEFGYDPRPSGIPEYTQGLAVEKAKPPRKYGWGDFVQLQIEMYRAIMKYNSSYPYTSEWYKWPILNEFYPLLWSRGSRENTLRCVILVGNPIFMWMGFLAAFVCLFAWLKHKDETAKLLSLLYFTLWLSWPLVPRNAYFLYYYFPAAMILSLNIVFAFQFLKVSYRRRAIFLSACAGVFALLYPILSGWEISTDNPYRAVLDFWGLLFDSSN